MKAYIVVETYEDSNCIRESSILGVYAHKHCAIKFIYDWKKISLGKLVTLKLTTMIGLKLNIAMVL